ncbi:MAG: helix-turn-helix transcriptional regulator [Clostridia bacterium]|nr:helix-turn-helix transcriptional regulator [Clostridia bacterium]MBR1683836.1 helix-turn-helix transcriptional regulator [Clostridia bacterium]MBR2287559.1 helix-turn-helix transcriptional regulator [Clostridia bacterium]
MSSQHNCPCSPQCALQSALDAIGGKWKLPVLCSLSANGKSRYNELLRNVQGISNTMLSQTLRELEQDGLVLRNEYLEVPIRVEYTLSDHAKKLQPILLDLIRWRMEKGDDA